MFGFGNGVDHRFDFCHAGIVRHERLITFELHLGASHALDRQQCGPHWLNTAFSGHAVDDQCDGRGLFLFLLAGNDDRAHGAGEHQHE